MRLHASLLIGLLTVAVGTYAADPTFEFVVPWDDASPTVTDLSGLIPRPAGARGFVRATPDGHLAVDDGRIRFWGTNMTFGSSFPDKAIAGAIASHLAKFGVNMVRFHHMDTTDAPNGGNGIWTTIDPDRTIDAGQLDRLDYFIAQLKDRGIYSDVNLLVGRPFNGTGGDIPDGLAQVTDWKVRAAVGFFDAGLQRMQMQYASDLLSHVNPYTGLTYAADPAVALVEINNENGLAQAWMSNQVDGLPSPILASLRAQWNAWLAGKYSSQAELESAWGVARRPAGGELLQNGGFGAGVAAWNGEQHESARATFDVDDGAARIQVTAAGTQGWHVQLNQGGLSLEPDHPYTLTFRARASEPRTIEVDLGMNEAPWEGLGFRSDLPLTTEWRTFSFTLSPARAFVNGRVNFSNMGLQTGTVWIDDVSFRPGGVVGLGDGESLDRHTIEVFRHQGETVARTQAGRHDWMRFLLATEDGYWTTMRRHLKETLGVRALVVGTIVGTSTPNLMAQFDAVDSHAYWRHPEFPSVAWSSADWLVRNDAMVNDQAQSTMVQLAMKRVVGKPHLVTEYNHPSPNGYEAEAFPFLATYGALQDFDAVFSFDWNGGWTTWDARMIQGYFDVGQNPIKLATLVPVAAAFLRGDIAPAQGQVVVSMTREDEIAQTVRSAAWTLADARTAGVNPLEALRHRVAIQVDGTVRPETALAPGSADVSSAMAVSDTGQVTWDAATSGRGVVSVDTALTKLVYGFAGGRPFELSGFRVEVGRSAPTALDGFAVVGLTSMDGATLDVSRRMVLTVAGGGINTGARLTRYGGEAIAFPPALGELLTFGTEWGTAPSRVEGVPATIAIPGSAAGVQVWALDERGGRRQPVRVDASSGRATIEVSGEYRAVWYEIAR